MHVASSVGGSTTNQKPLGTPQEISLPGGPGSIDSVALGPDWVVVAKKVRRPLPLWWRGNEHTTISVLSVSR
jgi:hypothetical protein